MNRGALSRLAFNPDVPTLGFQQPPHNRQANAAAPGIAVSRPRPVHPVETLEDMRQVVRGYPYPAILHQKLYPLRPLPDRKPDMTACVSIMQRVRQQIYQDLF